MSMKPMKPLPSFNSTNQKNKLLTRSYVMNKDGEQIVVIQLLGRKDVKKFLSDMRNEPNIEMFMGRFLNPIFRGYFESGELQPTKWSSVVLDNKGRTIYEGFDELNPITKEQNNMLEKLNIPNYEISGFGNKK